MTHHEQIRRDELRVFAADKAEAKLERAHREREWLRVMATKWEKRYLAIEDRLTKVQAEGDALAEALRVARQHVADDTVDREWTVHYKIESREHLDMIDAALATWENEKE